MENKEKILIVDTDEDCLKILKEELCSKYEVNTAESLDSTIASVNTNRPNLIIMDTLQDHGFKIANTLKSDSMTSEIPIIFTTKLEETQNIPKVFEAGGVDYISKPFNKIEVRAKVKNTLQIFRLRDSLSNALSVRQEHILQIENQLETIDKHVPRVYLDLDKNLIDVSSAYCELLGMDKNYLIDREKHCLDSEDIFKEVDENGIWRGEINVISDSNKSLWFDTTVSHDKNCFGRIRGYIATFSNITNEKLVKEKNKKLDEFNKRLEDSLSYLKQFKEVVEEASIFSITDQKGVIKEVNKNFENISGYSADELIGQPHNIVRHPDMPKEAFKDMWDTIKSGAMWKGLVKNKRKDDRPYYVISEIAPIYDREGNLKEYIGIRIDVTELEEYKNILKNELDTKSKSLEENINYTTQYEEAINKTTAITKSDITGNITYANQKCCELSGYSLDELKTMKCKELRDEKFRKSKVCDKIKERLANKEIVEITLDNISKNGSRYTTKNLFYPIVDLQGNVVEHLQIMYDITELVELNEEIINTQKEVVLTMGAIGESRSKETGHHVNRVAEFSYLLAKLHGLDENEASLLKQASPMHDIGKVGIPDSILKKPAKLTDEEFEIMKTHAELGYNLLKHSQRPILKAAAQVAYTHHEKWDGTGYPNKLAKEDIPIFGRITAITDVLDALSEDRVYKKAWPMDDIKEFFKEQKGRHFDPELTDLLLENFDQFLEIKERLKD
jgi:PAS domain S-box-containing protein